jgi:hypothetical protein
MWVNWFESSVWADHSGNVIKNGESIPVWLRLRISKEETKWYVVMTAKGENADDAM